MLFVDSSSLQPGNGYFTRHPFMNSQAQDSHVEHCTHNLHDQQSMQTSITSNGTGVDGAVQAAPTVSVEPGTQVNVTIPGTNDVAAKANAFDVLGDRRKRRKVSTEPADKQGQDETHSSGLNTPVPAMSVKQTAESKAKKRRGRPAKSSPGQVDAQNTALSASRIEASPLRVSQRAKKDVINYANVAITDSKADNAGQRPGPPLKSQKQTKVTLKNGRFAQSLVVALNYAGHHDSASNYGQKINEILSRPKKGSLAALKAPSETPRINAVAPAAKLSNSVKSTHPFFLAKQAQPTELAGNLPAEIRPDSSTNQISKPVAWSDMVFQSKKQAVAKDIQLCKPAWPPHLLQHVGIVPRNHTTHARHEPRGKAKARLAIEEVDPRVSILNTFQQTLNQSTLSTTQVEVPKRMFESPKVALSSALLDIPCKFPIAVSQAREQALHGRSFFDAGQANGPLPWTHKYAPQTHEEVLQRDSHKLHDWLGQLVVNNIKQGVDSRPKPPARRKAKLKKSSEMDDFIVEGDIDDLDGSSKTKNAILLVGPAGCGKSSSVFAVAKQLNFEVFEIHPGMRRSQKDIFDRVGDMAHNHLVQGKPHTTTESGIHEETAMDATSGIHLQPSVASFFGNSTLKAKPAPVSRMTPQPKKEMKQSLVLFEEVDNVFEDDRGFWSGVQSFIHGSKRPVILTCNDVHNVPVDELDLFDILHYEPPDLGSATAYLCAIAAAEGHLIQPSVIRSLYLRLNRDLRAAITNLDFWCQMTIGSTKGGLDWYPGLDDVARRAVDQSLRTYSNNSYSMLLDIKPAGAVSNALSNDDWFAYANECLDAQPLDLLDQTHTSITDLTLDRNCDLMETLSIIDTMNGDAAAAVCSQLMNIIPSAWNLNEEGLADAQLQSHSPASSPSSMFECLQPLEFERPVFPPAQGRLAPSLDAPTSVLAIDVAPYVRTVAAFDLRLERVRDELFSSQGKKTRSTRAARAAAEGGDKANTRRERWFPEALDLKRVMATGGDWPHIWEDVDGTTATSPADSMDMRLV